MKRHCKLIISTITVALIFTLVLSPCSFALSKQQFGAWIASALTASQIFINSAHAPINNFIDDYLCDPFVIVEQSSIWDYIPYTFEDTDDFYDRSVLKIDKDIVNIDGVDYTDIWLSTDAAEKFRTNAYDLKTALNIASQSEGTFVSGVGFVDGKPLYESGGVRRTQNISVPFTHGNYLILNNFDVAVSRSGTDHQGTQARQYGQGYGISKWLTAWESEASYPYTYYVQNNGLFMKGNGASVGQLVTSVPSQYYVDQPFDFDWVAGTIPADEQLTDEGLRVRVPTSDINQWYQDYPDTGPNVTINMGDPELTQKIDDLIDLIIPLIPVLDIDFVEYEAPEPEPIPEPIPEPDPYPDPDPQPGTVITDLDWSDLFQTIKNIYNNISEQVSITKAIKNILDKIKWFIDDFFGDLGDLINTLPELFERHVIDTIRRGLTGLKNIFLPVLALLRSALGIWHYVVEWFQAISTPFTFYLSLLSQGYPLITVPIYAAIAGVIVIAVYRRFGR